MGYIALEEYGDVCISYSVSNGYFRVFFADDSFPKVWLGYNDNPMGRFGFHWERRHIDGAIYRHDNAPHGSWKTVASFPKHFHNGSELNVEASHLPDAPLDAIRYFLDFARNIIS